MTRATEDRTAHPFEVVSNSGVRLQCWRWGESPRVVVAVHGLNAHGLHWRRLAERLLPEHSLVSYDLRGHGDSDKPPAGYSHDDHGHDLDAVIRRVAPAPPVLIGHSFGARISIPYAARHPLRGFVIVDPGIVPPSAGSERSEGGPRRPPETMRAALNGARQQRRAPGLQHEFESEAAFMERMRRTNFLRNWSPYNEEYARNLIEPDGTSGVRLKMRPDVHRQIIDGIRTVDLLAYLKDIACPTLVIRATEGHLRADIAERMVRELPNARLSVVEGANHNVMLDQPEAFEPLIEDFLDELYRD